MNDLKHTMAEVAANIESKTSMLDVKRLLDSKVERNELHHSLQAKISQDEMKAYCEQIHSERYVPIQEELEEEIRRIKIRIDKQATLIHSQTQTGLGGSALGELGRVESTLMKKISELEDLLQDKASKQSVAQALHKKLNKQESEEVLTNKADIQDLRRVMSQLEMKADAANLQQIYKILENKADKYDI